MSNNFWSGFEKRAMEKEALWGFVAKQAIKPLAWIGKKMAKNPLKTLGAAATASDIGAAAKKGVVDANVGKNFGSKALSHYNSAKMNVGVPTF